MRSNLLPPHKLLKGRILEPLQTPISPSGSAEKTPVTDVVMCEMIGFHVAQHSDSNWEPPMVTQELTYPLEDEIIPNPTMALGKATRFPPQNGKLQALLWPNVCLSQGDLGHKDEGEPL